MFTGLAIFFKTGLKFTLLCGNNKSSVICTSCTNYHIKNIVLVTRGIEQSELFRFGLKIGTTNFNSLTFGLLFITGVHDIGEPPWITTLLLGLLLEPFNRALVDHTHLNHEISTNCWLACVAVTNENNWNWWSCGVNFNTLLFVDNYINILNSVGLGFFLFLFKIDSFLFRRLFLTLHWNTEDKVFFLVNQIILCKLLLSFLACLGVPFFFLFLQFFLNLSTIIKPVNDIHHVFGVSVQRVVQVNKFLLLTVQQSGALSINLYLEEFRRFSLHWQLF